MRAIVLLLIAQAAWAANVPTRTINVDYRVFPGLATSTTQKGQVQERTQTG